MLTRNKAAIEKKDGYAENQRQVLTDVLSNVLPKLQVGLDINVKFGSVKDFEYTQELDSFYLLGMDLVHGLENCGGCYKMLGIVFAYSLGG